MIRENTRLVGHGLLREGRAFEKTGNQTRYTGDPTGVAVCECGETSVVLDSTSARQRWHKIVHKPAMRAEMEKASGE